VDRSKVLAFSFVEGFGFAVALAFVFAHATKARF
jgi:hypothetical protein